MIHIKLKFTKSKTIEIYRLIDIILFYTLYFTGTSLKNVNINVINIHIIIIPVNFLGPHFSYDIIPQNFSWKLTEESRMMGGILHAPPLYIHIKHNTYHYLPPHLTVTSIPT